MATSVRMLSRSEGRSAVLLKILGEVDISQRIPWLLSIVPLFSLFVPLFSFTLKIKLFCREGFDQLPVVDETGWVLDHIFRGFLKFFNTYRKQYCCISYNVGVQSLCLKTRQLNALQRFLWVGWFFFCSPYQEMQWINCFVILLSTIFFKISCVNHGRLHEALVLFVKAMLTKSTPLSTGVNLNR